MQISDILTFLGILLAVYAVINERERAVIKLKFGIVSVILILFVFIWINVLVIFNWYPSFFYTFFPFLFSDNGWEPKFWAYPLTILLILFIFLKVYVLRFPSANNEKLVRFYDSLLNRGDYENTLGFIENYHKSNIEKYLKNYDKEPSFKQNNEALSRLIFSNIITREDFVQNVATENPKFFCDFLRHLTYHNSDNEEFVYCYLKTLFFSNNQILKKELKKTFLTSGIVGETFNDENDILNSLLANLDVVTNNYAYNPIGEAALLELEFLNDSHFLNHPYNYILSASSEGKDIKPQSVHGMWDTTTYKAVRFFDMMLRKAIETNVEKHLWLYYYERFAIKIIENLPTWLIDDSANWKRSENISNGVYIVNEIISNMLRWYTLMKETKHSFIAIDTSKCISNIFKAFANSEDIPKEWSAKKFSYWLDVYFNINKPIAKNDIELNVNNSIRDSIIDVIIRPDNFRNDNNNYHNLLKYCWNNSESKGGLDKYKYTDSELEDFKNLIVTRDKNLHYLFTND